MSEKLDKTPAKPGAKKTREQRLSEALRANLQRRKAQGRARKTADGAGADGKA